MAHFDGQSQLGLHLFPRPWFLAELPLLLNNYPPCVDYLPVKCHYPPSLLAVRSKRPTSEG